MSKQPTEPVMSVLAAIAPLQAEIGLQRLTAGEAELASILLVSAAVVAPTATNRVHAARALVAAGRPAEARAQADLAAEGWPDAAIAHDAVAWVAYAENRLGDAEAALRRGLACAPGDAKRWRNLATLLEASARPEEAARARQVAADLPEIA